MDKKIKKVFDALNIDFSESELSYFNNSNLVEPTRLSTKKTKAYFHIQIEEFLPVQLLQKIENKFKHNDMFNIKLIIDVVDKESLNKQILIDYLEFIKNYKAESGNLSYWSMIDTKNFDYDQTNNLMTFTTTSNESKSFIYPELKYCVSKLHQFGIKDIDFEIKVKEISLDILEEQALQELEKIKNQEVDQTQKTNKTSSKTSVVKKTSYNSNYKYKQSFDKPSYDSLLDLEPNAQNIIIHGMVMNKEFKVSKTGRKIFYIDITDNKSSIRCVYFSKSEQACEFDDLTEEELLQENAKELREAKINVSDWVALRGKTSYSEYDQEQVFYIDNFIKIEKENNSRIDDESVKRVELHTHTKMSTMDGVSYAKEYLKLVNKWNWNAIAFTDHINVQAYPDIYSEIKSINKSRDKDNQLKAIYGLEAQVVDTDKIWYVKNAKDQDLKSSKMVFFDLETTGLSPEMDEIIEFGAVVYDLKTGERKKTDILIKPEKPLKQFTKELTRITDEMLENKPSIKEAFSQIYEIIKDGILVAHNANFDFNFLSNCAIKLGYDKLTNTVIDTLTISRVVFAELKNHRLGTIAKKLGIDYDADVAHRADYDADVLADVYDRLIIEVRKTHNINTDTDWNKIHPQQLSLNKNYHGRSGYHLNILAKNQKGLKEIYKLVSKSHTKTFFSSPKVIKKDLEEFRKNNNLLIGSGCVNGEIFELARTNTFDELHNAIKFYDYIEIQPISVYKNLLQDDSLDLDQLKHIIKTIIKFAKQENKIIVATSDAHYTEPELKQIREVYISSKGLGGTRHPLFDSKNRVKDFPDQHIRTTKEMLDEFKWLNDDEFVYQIVVENTNKIADMVEANIAPVKDGLFTPKIDNVDEKLKNKCYETAREMYGDNLPEIVEKRLEKELNSIIKHGFAIVYWISHLLVKQSLEDGYLVGSRGSVGSSFVATTSKITEVNPLKAHYRCTNCKYSDFDTDPEYKCGYDLPEKNCPKCNQKLIGDGHDIPFETFLGFDGDKVPDIDLNFSGEYQPTAHNFTKKMFGEDNVFRAGTISTVAEKTAFGYVKAFYEETKQNQEQPRKVEINRLAKLAEGVKRTTGQHPGGIIILPNEFEIEDFTPVNYPADDTRSSWKTTHFDFHSIHDNLLKMDILGHVDPTALRMLLDLTGVDPITVPTDDKRVYSLFSGLDELEITSDKINGEITGAIGIPEFGTGFVRGMLRETQPKTFADLVQISGLSHGTDVWLGNARDLIRDGKANISTVIGCRDDIMVYLLSMGLDNSLAFVIMESVRKGKGLKKEWVDVMKKHNVPDWYIESCLKIKYMFPKAHATAYVLMAYRIAWYKIYYPAEYYATFLSTRADAFDIETTLGGYDAVFAKVKQHEQRLKNGEKVSKKDEDLYIVNEILLEMFARKIKFTNINFEKSQATRFIVDTLEDGSKVLIPPFNIIDSLGEAVAMSIISARKDKKITSVNDLKNRTQVTQTQIKLFEKLGILNSLASDEQLAFEF
ncbi:DNA polymerase III alpha chain [Mycoplasma yeatsii 13926]|uniref:DNA polymerase III PolC-type n=1 Tax=Mycoplasma yeatsii 13926 TaxID=1188240 RepID=S6G6Z2_9MOLU|nr:PolC-type DNA polymerase III [Mycoplasma yeatsii]EOA07368.1 DNA polymerase III alpha chain [Mycoplasma yeatsii 13926]